MGDNTECTALRASSAVMFTAIAAGILATGQLGAYPWLFRAAFATAVLVAAPLLGAVTYASARRQSDAP